MSSYLNTNKNELTMKFILIGDSGVGKSSLLYKFVHPEKAIFFGAPNTIVSNVEVKEISINDLKIKINIWDTAGQETYRAAIRGFYRNAHGCVIAYDISNRQSFQNVTSWYEEFEKYADIKQIPIVLVGNKIDIEEGEVSTEDGQNLANDLNINAFYESSAVQGINVQEIFTWLAQARMKYMFASSTDTFVTNMVSFGASSFTLNGIQNQGGDPKKSKGNELKKQNKECRC